tara:strand:+ start:65 stop:475 length:411 start_codon:yes stop_codon:yes gene_type:complete
MAGNTNQRTGYNKKRTIHTSNSTTLRQVGTTTENYKHRHQYEVDENGNGWAYEVGHPKNNKVKHRHKIENWIVDVAASNCWPYCERQYGISGSPKHTHGLQVKQNNSDLGPRGPQRTRNRVRKQKIRNSNQTNGQY